MNADTDVVGNLLGQCAKLMATAAHNVPDAAVALAKQLVTVADKTDQMAQFALLPLCLALFILHENYRAATEGNTFRVTYVLGRTAAVIALVLGYSKVCGLLTLTGGHWMSGSDLLSGLEQTKNTVGDTWAKFGNLSDWPKFALILLVSLLLLCSLLFAYVAGLLLSLIQGAVLAVLLILGKPCIIASLVPGVGVGGSWARALAQVAAWSMVAGVITKLLGGHGQSIHDLILAGAITPMVKVAAQYIVLALATLAVPTIASMVFSGAAGGVAGGMMGALATGYMGAKALGALGGGLAKGAAKNGKQLGSIASGLAKSMRSGGGQAPATSSSASSSSGRMGKIEPAPSGERTQASGGRPASSPPTRGSPSDARDVVASENDHRRSQKPEAEPRATAEAETWSPVDSRDILSDTPRSSASDRSADFGSSATSVDAPAAAGHQVEPSRTTERTTATEPRATAVRVGSAAPSSNPAASAANTPMPKEAQS